MKYFLVNILYPFLYIAIFLIQNCKNRELESPETIIENLYRFLNTGFNPNQTIIINNKYYFNISFIQPMLNYTNYSLEKGSITLIEPKLILYYNSKLFIPFKSKVNYRSVKNTPYNSLSLSIVLDVNFSKITFNKLEDNSYILDYQFNNNNFLENSNISFNYIENYSFFKKKEITSEEKKKLLDIYINNLKLYLEQYPECDGLFLFNKIGEYMLRTKRFNSGWINSGFFDDPEVLYFNYEKHIKIENIKSKMINIEIKVSYYLCEVFNYACVLFTGDCKINDIIIYNKNITYGKFQRNEISCTEYDEELIKHLINTSKDAMIQFL